MLLQKMKHLADGRAMLNIGCGPRTHQQWNNVDFSAYARLARHQHLVRFMNAVGILSAARYRNLLHIDPDIIYRDVRKGIPFADGVFDVVYHSHFLGHIDHTEARSVLQECRRVLKPGGMTRIVLPDLEQIVQRYGEAVRAIGMGRPHGHDEHAQAIAEMFELMVRTRPRGTAQQSPFVRLLEWLVRSGMDQRGELRRWHYDQYVLGNLLRNAGFEQIQVMDASDSRIVGWQEFSLDTDQDGSVYKPGSLYMEACK